MKPMTNNLPPYSYLDMSPKSKVLYVRTASEADRAIVMLRRQIKTDPTHKQVLGFDLEWKPKFISGERENPVALIQLASKDLIVLAQVSAMEYFPIKLKDLLEDSNVYKAGMSIISDCEKLYRDHKVVVHSCIELTFLAMSIDRKRWNGDVQQMIGLPKLVEAYLLKNLIKGPVKVSNWELNLNQEQQTYAANDAHCGLMLFHRLLDIAYEMDRLPRPEYFSFDVIGQGVSNLTTHTCLPRSLHTEQFYDKEGLSNEHTSSDTNSGTNSGVGNEASADEGPHWCANIAGLVVWAALIRWWFFSTSSIP